MNNRVSYITAIIMLLVVSLPCYADCSDGTTFTISSNVNLPVTIKPNGKSAFKIYQRNYTTSQRIADATITDVNGNRCMYRHSKEYCSGNVHHYFEITGIYSSSTSSYDNDSSSDNSSFYDNNSSSSTSELAHNLVSSAFVGMSIPCEGHPYISIGGGMSKSCGEFLRVKFVTGGVAGIALSGSVGKDWVFDEEYADKLSWNAGLGLRFGDENNDITINILVGRTPWHPEIALMANLEYEHFFGDAKRFGLFGNIGVATTDLSGDGTKAKGHFDFMVGCAVKLWQK